ACLVAASLRVRRTGELGCGYPNSRTTVGVRARAAPEVRFPAPQETGAPYAMTNARRAASPHGCTPPPLVDPLRRARCGVHGHGRRKHRERGASLDPQALPLVGL